MSQAGILDIEAANPQIPTQIDTDENPAIPIANILEVLGETVANGTFVKPVFTTGSGNTVTINVQVAGESGVSDINLAGLSSFDSDSFSVDSDGFVTLTGGGSATTEINVDAFTAPGTNPVTPNSGAITVTGDQVASGVIGANVIRSDSVAANTVTIEIQRSTISSVSDLTKNGVSHFDSSIFMVDGNGFVTANATGLAKTITGNSGGALSPTAGNWNIFGASTAAGSTPVSTSGLLSTLTVNVQKSQQIASTDATKVGLAAFDSSTFSVDANGFVTLTSGNLDLHDSRYIVSAGGAADGANYTTIASAYAAALAAGAPQTVFVQPGTYTENITLSPGINLCAHSCDSSNNVKIIGKLSASFAGQVSLSGIFLQTNSDYCLSVTGSAQTYVDLINCNILATNNNALEVNSSGGPQVVLQSCQGSLSATYAYIDQARNSLTQFVNCFMINNGASVAPSTVAGSGSIELRNTFFYNSITTSSTSNIICDHSVIQGALTVNSTGLSHAISNCDINGQISIGVGSILGIVSSSIGSPSSPAITGLGTLKYSGLSISGTNSLIDVSNQNPLVQSNDAVQVKSPGAYPYTTVAQDALIIVDTSEARTIIPMANPATGQRHVIKDNVGSAAAFPITITPSGKNIDGAASFNLNSNWASITITYNGTQWNIT